MSGNIFSKFFFQSLPFYFQSRDINTTLERFSSVFEDELEVYKGDIEGLPTLIYPLEVPSKFLSLLGFFYGMPPSLTNEADFREILSIAIPLYKIRGTENGLIQFFDTLGVVASITFEDNESKGYDKEGTDYDDPENLYDMGCTYCTGYDLTIYDPNEILPELGEAEPDPTYMANFNQTLAFLLPIGAVLKTLNYDGGIPD